MSERVQVSAVNAWRVRSATYPLSPQHAAAALAAAACQVIRASYRLCEPVEALSGGVQAGIGMHRNPCELINAYIHRKHCYQHWPRGRNIGHGRLAIGEFPPGGVGSPRTGTQYQNFPPEREHIRNSSRLGRAPGPWPMLAIYSVFSIQNSQAANTDPRRH